ncbi:MAG: PKD domain-containing protein [Candidatus Acetothermia bacterium]|jgi:chitodextrinase|nr:PKD domain-containing protein [Candidatus Acetothermia bacterium]
MEAQKGFSSLLIRSIGLAIIGSLTLLFPGHLDHLTSAQMMAYPPVPLAIWSDGHNATEDIAYGLAVDFRGEVVVVGTSGIIKYSEAGRKLWEAPYAGIAYGVATDSLADIVVAGTAGLVKLTSAGERLWAVAGEFHKVAAMAGDRLVVCGPAGVEVYSPAGERLASLAYPGEPSGLAGSGDIVVVIGSAGIAEYYLQAGERLWQIPCPGEPTGVALDSQGSVLIVGSGGIAKYSPTGRLIWQEPFLGEPQGVATLPAKEPLQGDEIVVTGGHKGAAGWDYRTVKYNSEGEELWEVRYDGGLGDDIPYAVAASPAGRIYVTGASTLAKEAAVDEDYYTIQYGEKPLPEAVEGLEGHECLPGTLPLAEFELSNPSPLTDELIFFINRAHDPDGYLVAWSWAFGDGNTSRAWEPEHRYGRKGRYTVTLTVVDNDFCTATAEGMVEVGNRPPEADFTWAPLTPTDLEEALFTPEFADPDGEIALVRWELGDGTVVEWESAREFGPPGQRNQLGHQYPDDGIYTVRMIVADDDGAEAEVIKEITVLNVPPEASFTWEAGELRADFTWTVDRETHGSYPPGFDPTELMAGLDVPFDVPTELDDVLFEDRSGAGAIYFSAAGVDHDGQIVSWHWDFGDGESSEEQNPSH